MRTSTVSRSTPWGEATACLPESPGAQVEPDLSVDPRHPNHLTATWMTDGNDGLVSASSSGLGPWPVLPGPGSSRVMTSGMTEPARSFLRISAENDGTVVSAHPIEDRIRLLLKGRLRGGRDVAIGGNVVQAVEGPLDLPG